MARRRGKKSRRSGSKKLPLAIMVPLAIPAIQAGKYILAGQMNEAKYEMTGVDMNGTFHGSKLMQTYAPVAAGIVVHRFAGRYVNRYIPKWLPVSL